MNIARIIGTAALMSGFVLVDLPASAMGFTNCTRSDIRIDIHDNGTGEPLPGQRPAGMLPASAKRSFELGGGLFLVKIFRVSEQQEKLVYLRGDLSGDVESYTFHRSGGHSFFKVGDDCTAAERMPVKEPTGVVEPNFGQKPFATSMVTSGIWVSGGAVWFDISDFDGESFRLRLSSGSRKALGLAGQTGQNAWSTYRLVAKNRYRDADGNNLVIREEFRAVWNGIPHRYSWLE